jgi:hypothetical protein
MAEPWTGSAPIDVTHAGIDGSGFRVLDVSGRSGT